MPGIRAILLPLLCSSFCWAQGTVPFEEAPPALQPAESAKKFEIAEGLDVSLVVAEPDVSQPLSITFDDRGRMWVLQYLQFPNPNGLKPIEVDNWLRTKYDKLPDPPPKGPKGQDRISIYQDTNGDGRADKVKHFLDDLNLASGMALGHGGVFVAQPPYLLFYADRNHDDVPDGDPEVLLTGFGLNDAHAFANSLTWGPDGWLYGAQGSTTTAEIRGIGFQQGVWRYHPLTKDFELFAEGGGNTWGIDFDPLGNLFAGGNTVEPLMHHVQGAYYVKGFGKHGPLHNPHAYGYFQPVKHHGYAGDSLTGGFVLYHGGAFPARFDGVCIAPNTRHSAMRWSTLETLTSTFATRAAGDFLTTSDIWFRPVDSTIGPDGALYVADWYDYNIAHSSPKNRSKWYQPSRADGRVWRIAPQTVKPPQPSSIDLAAKTSSQLVDLLSHSNNWYRRQARRLLAERSDASVLSRLMKMLDDDDQRLALQALWSIYVSGGFDREVATTALQSRHASIRAWSARLLGDRKVVSNQMAHQLIRLAREDPSAIVRSQLACTAKRLPPQVAMSIVTELIRHEEDANDIHLPLLIWWAIEDKAVTDTPLVLRLFESGDTWRLPVVRKFILERVARRFAAENNAAGFDACSELLRRAPTDSDVNLILTGVLRALSGKKLEQVPARFAESIATLLAQQGSDPRVLQLAIRTGSSTEFGIKFIDDNSRPDDARISVIKVLGETQAIGAVEPLIRLLSEADAAALHPAVLFALTHFGDEQIPNAVLAVYSDLALTTQSQAIDLLCGRRSWAMELLAAIQDKSIDPKTITLGQVRRLLAHEDKPLHKLVDTVWGQVQPATPLEKQGRIAAISQLLSRARGDSTSGAKVFDKKCANCHKLRGRGTTIGPDLTGAERKNRAKLLRNIVDPSAEVRPQFISHVAVTTDGRVLTGLLADSTADAVTLLDAKNKRTILNRDDLEKLRESPTSLMPEKILGDLTDQQIRDLFAYLQVERK